MLRLVEEHMSKLTLTIVCQEFRPSGNGGKLVGFAKIKIEEMRMLIDNIPIFKGDDGDVSIAGLPPSEWDNGGTS
jgi:hypothetical protein